MPYSGKVEDVTSSSNSLVEGVTCNSNVGSLHALEVVVTCNSMVEVMMSRSTLVEGVICGCSTCLRGRGDS